jgi:hypothetical protein
MGKMNNQQRRSLCLLVDEKAKVDVEKIDISDGTMLKLTSDKIRENKDYPSLDKEYKKLVKKFFKKDEEIKNKIAYFNKELQAINREKQKISDAIKKIGIDPKTGDVIYDKEWTSRNYINERYTVQVYGENKKVWDKIMDGLNKDKQSILDNAVKVKEKIWLCETTESAEMLIQQ